MTSDFRASNPSKPKPDPKIANRKIAEHVAKQADKLSLKATKQIERLDRLADHLEAVEVWTRSAGTARKPRLSRDDIAAAAIRIADDEGFEALSMRRLAAELDVGTMSLYHYVKTKDELLTLVMDAFMGEVVAPPSIKIPNDWRHAITLIARRTRTAIERLPWVLDINDDPPIGPNSIRHFDQTQQAVSALEAPLALKLDLMMAVDEFVFGHCLHARNNLRDDEASDEAVLGYMRDLISGGDYPTLSSLVDEHGFEPLWHRINAHMRDPDVFERNLSRLLDGFEASLRKR